VLLMRHFSGSDEELEAKATGRGVGHNSAELLNRPNDILRPLTSSNPMTAIPFMIGLWFFFYLYWAISAIGVKKSVRGRPWSQSAGLRILLVIVAVLLLRIFHVTRTVHVRSSSNVLNGIGVVLCVAGLAFAVWARLHLGRNWGPPMSLREGHEIITTGPYRYVRHPIYSGILLALLGSGLSAGRRWFVAFIVVSAFFIFSARTEERLMLQQFPNEYPEYKKRTKALIPFVW
jgi:protein-S-isoprenylcysteine O-methyltransferase Ste14